jgi:hypothetical protein
MPTCVNRNRLNPNAIGQPCPHARHHPPLSKRGGVAWLVLTWIPQDDRGLCPYCLNTGVIPKAGMQAAVKGRWPLASQSCTDNGRSKAVSRSIGWKRRIGRGTPGHRSLSRQCTGPSAPMARRSPTGSTPFQLKLDRHSGRMPESSAMDASLQRARTGKTKTERPTSLSQ